MNFDYRTPKEALIPAFERFRDAFLPQDQDMWTGLFSDGRTNPLAYIDWLQRSAENRDLPPGIVPMTTFWVFSGEEMIGELTIRHYLRGSLLRDGGHVGYSVHPRFRGQGAATEMLQFALRYLGNLGEVDALITMSETNNASVRVVEKCGGIRIVDSLVDGHIHRRYLVSCNG